LKTPVKVELNSGSEWEVSSSDEDQQPDKKVQVKEP